LPHLAVPMTAQSELEIRGNFLTHPFAELLAEIAAAHLNGSLRVSDKQRKCIVYFKGGRVVFAVSNARSSRIFDILLSRKRLTNQDITRIPNFQNDFELTAYLKEKHLLTSRDCDKLFAEQIEAILVDVLAWGSGEWTFSYLARARDGLEFDIDATRLLVDFARCMPPDKMLTRFRSLDERFSRAPVSETSGSFQLRPDEAFVLSRAVAGPLTAAGLLEVAAMSQAAALHAIYTLWLGGLLIRTEWQPAFSPESVNAMRSARLEIKREAKVFGVAETPASSPNGSSHVGNGSAEEHKHEPEITLSLDDYLERVESAETFYDILGVEPKADVAEIKKAYFALARKFHPDRYHADGGEQLTRVQRAFTELAQANETLKNAPMREVYDYRIRKELAEREKALDDGQQISGHASLQYAQASESFERGFTLLMDGEADAALQFLARAAHYAPKNARYRAYYGKALSSDDKKRHQAESEMQTAVKMEPNNATFRLLLAEFFVQQNLVKRAQGELNRLLAIHPTNREALDMLARLTAT
jgi:curved DNA-binding protein CbpA